MTRHHDHRFAFVSSTFGVTLLSIVAVWTVSSVILDPTAPRDPNAIHQPASKISSASPPFRPAPTGPLSPH